MAITVSENGETFERDGKPFFYLADTVWCAFTNPAVEEWEEYLDYRRRQGFNALQINILPQWDRSRSERDAESRLRLEPFARKDDGAWDIGSLREDYFQRAREMVAMAHERGFIPALVLLWCDFVPGTWGSRRFPGHAMPRDAVVPYVEYVSRLFSAYDPIYLVSGDTDMETKEAVDTYLLALETLKRTSPQCLAAFHLSPMADLPDEIVGSPHLDFTMYQSGHQKQNRNLTFELAKRFRSKTPKRPVVNGEPCYEGHGIVKGKGRYDAREVRRAVWQSLFSGAKAGVAYGAHGIWSWQRKDSEFPSKGHSSLPLVWREALRFRGAWDIAFAKWIFETHSLADLQPSEAPANEDEDVRLAASSDGKKLAFYSPHPADVTIDLDLGSHDCVLWNLEEKLVARPEVIRDGDRSVIRAHGFPSDVLFLALRS